MRMHRFSLMMLALVLILAMCGPAVVLAEGEKVQIEFFNQKREALETFQEILAMFHEQNADVEVVLNGGVDSATVLATRAASGDLPDVFTDWPQLSQYKEFVNAGFIQDLTGLPLLDNVQPAILELGRLGDGIWCVPVALNTYGVFYSVKDFEELGLTPPVTYDEFVALCEALKAAGKTPIVFPDKDSWTIDHFYAFNSGVWTPDFMQVYQDCLDGKSHLTDNADVQKLAQRTLDLRLNYGQSDLLGTNYEDATREFATGNASMFFQGNWVIPSIKSVNPDFLFSMFVVPADAAEDTAVMTGVDMAVVVNADSQKKDAALRFVEFLTQPETATRYAELDNSPSAIKGVGVDLGVLNPLVEFINAGKSYPQLFNIQSSAIAAEEPTLMQSLIGSQDAQSFVQQLDSLWFNG